MSVVNWGYLARPVCSDSSWHCFVFGYKDAPFLWVWGGHLSADRFVTYFRGERSGEGQSDLPASVIYSSSFSVTYSLCLGAMFLG